MAATSSMSAKEMASREECLQSLGDFIDSCQETITSMLDTLAWTPEHFMQPRSHSMCHHNKDHRMSKSSLEKHAPVCELVSQGYSQEDTEHILEDRSYFYKEASCVYTVKPDLETLNSVLWNHHVQNHSVFYGYKRVPQTAEEEQMLMSREDRLAVAEYTINRAKEANRLKELGQDELLVAGNLADLIKKDNEERQLDPVEEMAALRDYRRRRQTYRAKNVHITKKSHTEIMREVINNQMEMYSQSVADETGQDQQHIFESETKTDSRSKKLRDVESFERRDRDDRSRFSRKSRSRSRDRSSGYNRYDRDERSSADRSTRDSRRRSRSRSENKEKSKHKHKHRSRSRSGSSERYKKSKHKKHKHKHKKHKKADRKSEDRDNENEKKEAVDEAKD